MAKDLSPGDRVRVREDFPPGHIRTPVYVRGKEGVVTRGFGAFPNPEVLALAIRQNRILVTSDLRMMPRHFCGFRNISNRARLTQTAATLFAGIMPIPHRRDARYKLNC